MLSAEASIEVVQNACQQIRGSAGLKQVLRSVLATGNLLNAGTNRGNAQGIKLDTLLKLSDVKVDALLSSPNHRTTRGCLVSTMDASLFRSPRRRRR